MSLQQGSMFDMTVVRSYTHEQHDSDGAAASQGRGSGDFVNSLQDAVRENPISAALIGMGVLWMFMGGSNTSLFGGGGRKSIFRGVGDGGEEVGSVGRDTAARIRSSVGHAADAASETVSHVAGGVREASTTIAEHGSRTAGQAADAVASAYDATTNAVSRAGDTLSNTATGTAHAMQEKGTKWGSTLQQSIGELFERQPLLLGAVGIAIGAGIAASVPATEAENKVMGGASDFVREAVSEKAAQVKEMADAAVHEAKAQGLTPEAAGEALRVVGDKVGAVAQAAATRGTSRAPKKI
jgi:hypothetical protein